MSGAVSIGGRGFPAGREGPPAHHGSGRLIDQMLATFRSDDYQPPTLPGSALELLELSRRGDVDFARVLALLERDPVVASQVLRKAQSAFYAGRQPIRSLHDAIVRLGLSTLRDMFLEVVIRNNVFSSPGYDEPMRAVQRHSVGTAYIARRLCEATGRASDGQYAFLSGLLHDVGMAMCMIVLADKKRPVAAVPELAGDPPPFALVWPSILKAHEPAGGILGHLWRLPAEITQVMSSHHGGVAREDGGAIALVVTVADWIASEAGAGLPGELEGPPREALARLKIDDAAVRDVLLQARGVMARLD